MSNTFTGIYTAKALPNSPTSGGSVVYGGDLGGGMSAGTAMAVSAAIQLAGQMAVNYYQSKVYNATAALYSQRREFSFKFDQLAYQGALLEKQHNLTAKQFELELAGIGMKMDALNFMSSAMQYEFEGFTSELNARQAEQEAQGVLLQGERDIGRLTLAAGQEKSNTLASQGARGVVLGEGSTAEVVASQDLVKEIDAITIEINSVFGSNARRVEATNYRNAATSAKVSAANSMLSSAFASQNSSLPGKLGAVAGMSADRLGKRAANIDLDYVPEFITNYQRLSGGQAALNTFASGVGTVAASWYQASKG